MGGVEKCKEKSAILAKICTNFKDLGVIYRSRGISLPEIVVWGGVKIVGNRVANFQKMFTPLSRQSDDSPIMSNKNCCI